MVVYFRINYTLVGAEKINPAEAILVQSIDATPLPPPHSHEDPTNKRGTRSTVTIVKSID